MEKKKNVNNRKEESEYKTRRTLYALAGIIGFGGALALMESGAGEARAFQFEEPIDAKRVICELIAEDAFLQTLNGEKESVPVSRKNDDCTSVSFGGKDFRSESEREFEESLRSMVAGYPIEAMLPLIVRYDREVAALLIGIAKKESNWGKRVPLDNDGRDCFNYWGFKGAGTRGIAMGHGCFGSPEEAVERVGNRIAELAASRTSEPSRMVVWKCGSSCAWDDPANVQKWISDVKLYYDKIARM